MGCSIMCFVLGCWVGAIWGFIILALLRKENRN